MEVERAARGIGAPALQHLFGGGIGGGAILMVFQRLWATITLVGELAAILYDRADRVGKTKDPLFG